MKRLLVLSIIALSGTLVGCGLSTPVKLPQQFTYTLNSVKPTRAASAHRSANTILVSLPIPDPGYVSNNMIYEPIPFDLRHFSNHQWAAPPAQMLMPLVAQALTNQGYFRGVVTTPFSGNTNYRLDTRLIALQQNFLRPQSREVLTLQETLTNNTTNQVMASRRFNAIVPAPQNNPYSGVVAANQAAHMLTGQIARWVVKTI
jgi:cholesterol transport system auxiliary component